MFFIYLYISETFKCYSPPVLQLPRDSASVPVWEPAEPQAASPDAAAAPGGRAAPLQRGGRSPGPED